MAFWSHASAGRGPDVHGVRYSERRVTNCPDARYDVMLSMCCTGSEYSDHSLMFKTPFKFTDDLRGFLEP